MKIRIVKIYDDKDDPNYIYIEADLFKSKHQPLPDNRVLNRVKKKDAYGDKSPSKVITSQSTFEPIEFEPVDLGVFNFSYLYFYMLIQNFFSRMI